MSDGTSLLVEMMKQVALGAVDAARPVNVYVGEVTREAPLEITINQQKRLSSKFLILTRNVTDHTINMEVNHVTEKMSGGAKDPSFQSHLHQYKGVKPFKVLNALKQGEKVLLVSMVGGQQYIVWDRLGEMQ